MYLQQSWSINSEIDSKAEAKGKIMMFIGNTEQKSNSIRMWDPHTTRVVAIKDSIWPKHMHYKPVDTVGVLELDNALEDADDVHDTPVETYICTDNHIVEAGRQCCME